MENLTKAHNDRIDLKIKNIIARKLGLSVDEITQEVIDEYNSKLRADNDAYLKRRFEAISEPFATSEDNAAEHARQTREIVEKWLPRAKR